MPEGPEVRRCAIALDTKLRGCTLEQITVNHLSRYGKTNLPGSEHLITPCVLERVFSIAKKIVFQFANQVFLVSFLGMEGHWQYIPGNHSGVILEFSNNDGNPNNSITAYYDDSRHFGIIDIVKDDYTPVFKHVGPCYFDNISLKDYTAVITRPRLKNKPIGDFLLCQQYFSGVGNYLRAEILYTAKISPHRKLGSLSAEEIATLLTTTTTIMWAAFEQNGLTIATYKDPDGVEGTYVPVVYNQKLDPLKNPVVREKCGDRIIHWVPAIQQ